MDRTEYFDICLPCTQIKCKFTSQTSSICFLSHDNHDRIILEAFQGNNEIKNILLRYNNGSKDSNNIAVATKEKAYDSQEIMVTT
jgi:hypothetical protein